MPEPIEFQALTALSAQLRTIRRSAGYFYDVEQVSVLLNPDGAAIESLLTDEAGPRPIVLLVLNDWKTEIVEHPDGLKVRVDVGIHWIHESDPTVDDDRFRVFFRGAADVERCLGGTDRSLGGVASDFEITDRGWDDSGSRVWAAFAATFTLFRTYGQPTGV